MLSDLNEKYLLRFMSCANSPSEKEVCLMDLLCSLGVKINFKNENPIYEIIDKMEYCGICYE